MTHRAKAVATIIMLGALVVTCLTYSTRLAHAADRSVDVGCSRGVGDDLARVVNRDPADTATRFRLAADCTYTVDETVVPQNNDEIVGPVGTFVQRGPASEPRPTTLIRGAAGVDQVIKPWGTFHGAWFRVNGGTFTGKAGSGAGIAGGKMSSNSSIYAVVVGHNGGAGITNAHGVFDSIELHHNTENKDALGFIGSGLKAVNEVEVKNSYIHDTEGNGIWCDEFCNDAPTANGKFWVHDNLVVDNGRDGVRYEKVDDRPNSGEALIENNEIHGNGTTEQRAGVGIRDASNVTVRGNDFGKKTIAGVTYGKNFLAVRVSGSHREDRPDLFNVNIEDNSPESVLERTSLAVPCRPGYPDPPH